MDCDPKVMGRDLLTGYMWNMDTCELQGREQYPYSHWYDEVQSDTLSMAVDPKVRIPRTRLQKE